MRVIVSLIIIQVLFGINYSTNKIVLNSLDPFLWSNIRFLIAGALMMVASYLVKSPPPTLNLRFFKIATMLSFLGIAFGLGAFLFGLSKTTSINASVITSLVPLLTLLISIVRGKSKLNIYGAIGFLTSFVGVILIVGIESISFGVDTISGDLLVLLAAFSWALFYNYGGHYFMEYNPNWMTAWMFLISGVFFSLFSMDKIINLDFSTLSNNVLYSAIYIIIGATVIAYTLNNLALTKAKSETVALFMYLQPIIAIWIGWYFLDENVTLQIGLGCLLSLAGVFLADRFKSAS